MLLLFLICHCLHAVLAVTDACCCRNQSLSILGDTLPCKNVVLLGNVLKCFVDLAASRFAGYVASTPMYCHY